jgi:branched-chain amino acid transport system substrate-binding protein
VKALSEVTFDGPRVQMQILEQRHATLTMYLAQVNTPGNTRISDERVQTPPSV